MTSSREVETARPFDGDLARARMLHLAEGILVGLTGCTPEQALAEMVAVARGTSQSTFDVAQELVGVAVGASSSAAVQQYWSEQLQLGPR